jgi:hypothetical protein
MEVAKEIVAAAPLMSGRRVEKTALRAALGTPPCPASLVAASGSRLARTWWLGRQQKGRRGIADRVSAVRPNRCDKARGIKAPNMPQLISAVPTRSRAMSIDRPSPPHRDPDRDVGQDDGWSPRLRHEDRENAETPRSLKRPHSIQSTLPAPGRVAQAPSMPGERKR